jgi:hypothetical protein
MAGPSSSFVPPQVTPSKAKRRFRLEEANRSLPLVSRIVRDIVATHQKVAHLQAQQPKQSKGTGKPQQHGANGNNTAQKELETSVDRLQSFVDELTSIGVELKDYQTGLVDFIGRHQGRDVYLCWKLGETSITHWHELQAGFSGRQPVATLEESD